MVNGNDEMMEVRDLDEDIKERLALIEEVKQLQEVEEAIDIRVLSDLRRRWRRIAYWESAYEDQLAEEFESYIDAFYGKRREGYQANQALKEALIKQAQQVSKSNEFNKATNEMNELMTQWRSIGSAGKETDDALWETFNEARNVFFDRKHQHWEDMQTKFGNARQIKEELIQRAKGLADSEEWQKTSEAFKTLMDEWKAAGSAGRECEDDLWNEFNALREQFYSRRNQHYEELHERQDQNYEAKKALVERAQAIADTKEYTREHTEQMKNLGVEWKQVGACRREKEDQIWQQFRNVMDGYFDGLKQFNEQRHAQWRQRMQDARNRKQELILNQKRQVKRMQEEMVGLLGQREIDEMEDRIADKEAFIAELEAELADIDRQLNA